MNERLGVAAKAVFEYAEMIQTPEYAEDIAAIALKAADAVLTRKLDELQSKLTIGPDASDYDTGFDDGVRGTIDAIRAALKGAGNE